jgi:hypothetical protein
MRSARALAFLVVVIFVAAVVGLRQVPPSGEPPVPRFVSGLVTAEHGPIPGARVRWRGSASLTQTDECGRFRLAADADRRTLTASKDGYFIGSTGRGQMPLTIRLERLPEHDNPDYQWVDPEQGTGSFACSTCHAEIHQEWRESGHSRSATGLHFRNLYEGTDVKGIRTGWGLLTQHELGADVCASCHAPTLPGTSADLADLPDGIAARGVHCDYCHKIAGVADGPLGLIHGRFNLKLLRPAGNHQVLFGPLDDVDRGEDVYSPLYRDAHYCASCHEGVVFGVHVYSTYSEWLDSPARRQGQHCQHCHMKPTGRMTNIAPGRGGIERDPATLGNHRFFDGSQADMLRRCIKVTADCRRRAGTTEATLTVSADAGHRVPTGFIDRHLLLVVEGVDSAGRPVTPESGPLLPGPAGRQLVGQPGKLYAKLLKDFDRRSPAPFWRADPQPEDNRLTPGQNDVVVFRYPEELARLRVRVLYRRFWQEVIDSKGWPDRDLLVFEKTFPGAIRH